MKSIEAAVDISDAYIQMPTSQKIWNGISFRLTDSQIHMVVGSSGSGKSTLGLSLFGLFPKSAKILSNRFSVLGLDLDHLGLTEFQSRVKKDLFLVPQNPNLAFHPYRKVSSQMEDFLRFSGNQELSKESILNLWEDLKINDPEWKWNSYPKNLSGGEKQRVCLSMAFLKKTKVLVLDEPTTGLDAFSEKIVLESVKKMAKSGVAVVFITHDLRIAESLGSWITIMKEGKVLESGPIESKRFEPKSDYGKELLKAHQIFV